MTDTDRFWRVAMEKVTSGEDVYLYGSRKAAEAGTALMFANDFECRWKRARFEKVRGDTVTVAGYMRNPAECD